MTTTQSKGSAIKGILGVKLGMTQAFDENNKVIPVTVVQAGPCVVTQVRTLETDGYEAIQLSFGAIDPKKVTKPLSGQFAKAGVTPRRYVGEIRTSSAANYTVGQEIKADLFAAGEIIDAQGTSIGKGTAGVMKRHNFRGFGDGHGVERKHRTSGSIGNRTTPGRVFKGKRMSGRMGIDTVTMQNLTIHSVDADKNVILVKGSIPGINGSQVVIRTAAKSVASEVLNKAGA
ncbi:MAG: 50S ribosomal protein L3 [Candidatus Nanopelagicaceae bacterium]|jgi:large subunit ribosomal protein L3